MRYSRYSAAKTIDKATRNKWGKKCRARAETARLAPLSSPRARVGQSIGGGRPCSSSIAKPTTPSPLPRLQSSISPALCRSLVSCLRRHPSLSRSFFLCALQAWCHFPSRRVRRCTRAPSSNPLIYRHLHLKSIRRSCPHSAPFSLISRVDDLSATPLRTPPLLLPAHLSAPLLFR